MIVDQIYWTVLCRHGLVKYCTYIVILKTIIENHFFSHCAAVA